MTICSKFGTRGLGVAVGVRVAVDVTVGGMGVNVKVAVGTGVGVGAGVEGTQAASKIKRKIQYPERGISVSVEKYIYAPALQSLHQRP